MNEQSPSIQHPDLIKFLLQDGLARLRVVVAIANFDRDCKITEITSYLSH